MTEVFITDQDARVSYVESLAACFISCLNKIISLNDELEGHECSMQTETGSMKPPVLDGV